MTNVQDDTKIARTCSFRHKPILSRGGKSLSGWLVREEITDSKRRKGKGETRPKQDQRGVEARKRVYKRTKKDYFTKKTGNKWEGTWSGEKGGEG